MKNNWSLGAGGCVAVECSAKCGNTLVDFGDEGHGGALIPRETVVVDGDVGGVWDGGHDALDEGEGSSIALSTLFADGALDGGC